MSDCVFCRIVAKQIPATVVHEDGETLAFMDTGQVNPGHVLVALKAHAENLFALEDAQAAAVFRTVARVARGIRAAFAPQGLSQRGNRRPRHEAGGGRRGGVGPSRGVGGPADRPP